MTRIDAVFALDQYEALRRQALGAPSGRGHGLGMALFLARGMVAWLTALKDLAPKPTLQLCAHSADTPMAPAGSELISAVAEMVLACCEEVSA